MNGTGHSLAVCARYSALRRPVGPRSKVVPRSCSVLWTRAAFLVSGLPGKDAIAVDWEKVLSRLSVPGITLLLVGAVICVQATRLCRFVLHDRGERAVLPVRIAGLVLALLGALILLDVFPGL